MRPCEPCGRASLLRSLQDRIERRRTTDRLGSGGSTRHGRVCLHQMSLSDRISRALRPLAAKVMRPGVRGIHERLDRIERTLGVDVDDAHKYASELHFWRWLIRQGGSQKQYGDSFEAVFGRWQRQRLIKLSEWLFLPVQGQPGDIDDWCAARSVVEIGAGPYPSVAAARKGWKRCVAVDPIAKGYSEEGLLPPAADRVVYIQAPGERIPLPAGFADLVINENCLDHVASPERVVAEMHRLLKAGGLLWFFVDLSHHRDHMHPHPMDETSIRALFGSFSLVHAEVSAHKAHPEAYGSFRALFRKPEEGQAIRPTSAYNATESGEQDRTPTSADVTRSNGTAHSVTHATQPVVDVRSVSIQTMTTSVVR